MNGRGFWTVAVTGGIASGKSTVSRLFQERGVPVHDADHAARAVVVPGSAGLADIVRRFGPSVLDRDGGLDRPAMRERIFRDPEARAALEAILHPRIREWLWQQAGRHHQPYAMLAIPLLAEHRADWPGIDRVLVIDIDPALQRQRLLQRDPLEPGLAERIIASQSPREARLAIADDLLDNRGSEAALQTAVAALDQRYRRLALRAAD